MRRMVLAVLLFSSVLAVAQQPSRVVATARVTVADGDMQMIPFRVMMPTIGMAFQTTGHYVQLNWTLSTSTTVSAQNVYRSTATNNVCGSQVLLASALAATATSYQDTVITQGTTYCYTVRAFDGINESPDSNVAKATWPFPPSAPANLTAIPK